MALPPGPTLETVLAAVSARCSFAASGKLSKTIQAQLIEAITSAAKQIAQRAAWARLLKDTDITLVTGQREYDVPDDCDGLGGIQWLMVEDTAGKRFPLRCDTNPLVDADVTLATSPGRPTSWKVINDAILVTKAPDAANWPTLWCVYLPEVRKPVNMNDRIPLDEEAVTMLATIKVKEDFNIGGSQTNARAEFERYLTDIRANTAGPGEMFGIASEKPAGPVYWNYDNWNPLNQSYTTSWNPWYA